MFLAQIALPEPRKISIRDILQNKGNIGLSKIEDTSTIKYKQNKDLSKNHLPKTTKAQLKFSLLPHQRVALEWMLSRERAEPRGGILGDDMGLGKSFTFLSLIMATQKIPITYRLGCESQGGRSSLFP
jgi:SNF2 family DNA or RNA helicase